MEKQMFQLKLTAKQLQRMHAKNDKLEKDELLKVKKAMEKGDMETARVYGQNATRLRNTGMGYLRLASRLEGVSSRIEQALQMKAVSKQMAGATSGMDKILSSMDLVKITSAMDKFEAMFEKVDVVGETVEGAMASSMASTVPEEQVDALLEQVGEEHGLEFQAKASQATASSAPVSSAIPNSGIAAEGAADNLEKRLEQLRSGVA